MSGHSSYVQNFFQLNFEHNGSSPIIHESTRFQILRLPQQGRKERLLIDEETRFYKIIPENCKVFFNNIKYFYESNFLSGVDVFLTEKMYDILKMTESKLKSKYPNKGLSYISSNNRDTFYLVINPYNVLPEDLRNQITEKERELRNILNNKQYYDTKCGYDKNTKNQFVGGTLKIQPQHISGAYTENIRNFEVTFQIGDESYIAKPIIGDMLELTFDTSKKYEFEITNPNAVLNITIQEQKDDRTEITKEEISLLSDKYKKKLEKNETFYFSFPHVQHRNKQLSVKIEFICSAISLLNRQIDDLYKEYIRFLPVDSKERFLVL